MPNFTCPNAIQLKYIRSLGCKWQMKAGKSYNTAQDEATIMCVCQRYCPTLKRIINSEGAPKCYEYHSHNNKGING